MKIEMLELELKSALLGTGLVQPVESTRRVATGARGRAELEVLCRQVPGQETRWLAVADNILSLTESAPLSIHLCRRYLRKNGKMVFGWHLGLSGSLSEVRSTCEAVVQVLAGARPTLDATPSAPASRPPPAPAARPPTPPEWEEPPPAAAPAQAQRRSVQATPGKHPPPRDAVPRPPGQAATGVTAPEGFMPTIRVVRNEIGADGKQRIEEEMPLPHVYHEMNRAKPGSTRGAQFSGDGGYHPAKTRR